MQSKCLTINKTFINYKQRIKQKKLEEKLEELNNFELGISSETNTLQTSNMENTEEISKDKYL